MRGKDGIRFQRPSILHLIKCTSSSSTFPESKIIRTGDFFLFEEVDDYSQRHIHLSVAASTHPIRRFLILYVL